MAEEGDIKTYNASQGIARERDLKIFVWHTNAMIQCRVGDVPGIENMSYNERKFNQVRGLSIAISAQEEFISIFSAQVRLKSLKKWEKKYKSEEEQKENPFQEENNDYNKLILIAEELNACRMDIIEADKTKKLDDDFILKKEDNEGNTNYELTNNFWDMLKELTSTYRRIQSILLSNKCINQGNDVDEDITEKEKDEEFIRRIVES